MQSTDTVDYSLSGLTIREAVLDRAKRFPRKADRPDSLLWSGLHIKTSDKFEVGSSGRVRVEFLSSTTTIEQGFDLSFPEGWLYLPGGEKVTLLRTWKDEVHEDVVEYSFTSNSGVMYVWNCYKMHYQGGQVVEEKWTENAGFWVEHASENERIYHCSHGMAMPPDFDCLVFKVSVYGIE